MSRLRARLMGGLRLLALGGLLAAGLRPAAANPNTGVMLYLPAIHSPPSLVMPPLPEDWLGLVNFYRASANLPPVVENAAWSSGNAFHARYTVKTDVLQHDEDPGSPWYTPEGQAAAQKSNLAAAYTLQASDAWAIAAWMQTPFHALGLLDPRLAQVGHGIYREADGGLQTASGLDVLRGLDYALPVNYPVIWPAAGAVVPLTEHWGGYPSPLASCPGFAGPSGLPLIVQLGPGNLTPSVTASAFAHAGTPLEHCVFGETNYHHPDGSAQALGRAILNSRDAVILIPRAPLTPGSSYTAAITANGRTHTWTFSVAANAASVNTSDLAIPAFAEPVPGPETIQPVPPP